MRLTSSGLARLAACLFVLIASACEPAPKVVPSGDVVDAPKIARATGAVLLQLSAYDYGLAGGYAGEKVRVVSPERYVTVARSLLPKLADLTSSSLSASANAAGPVRDAVVLLADAINDLTKDAGTYSCATDMGVFAKIAGDVATAWDRLRSLALKLPPDPELERGLARGPSFRVTAASERSAVTLSLPSPHKVRVCQV